jgi:hypothetical protein
MDPKVIWTKPKDEVPAVEVVTNPKSMQIIRRHVRRTIDDEKHAMESLC